SVTPIRATSSHRPPGSSTAPMNGADMVFNEPSDAKPCELGNASSYLVAVILCCKEADELAATILPATPAVFGDRWFFLVTGEAAPEKFVDPVSGETIVEIRDATAEFANVGASTIELDELLKAVKQLAAHTLGRRYCEVVIDGD